MRSRSALTAALLTVALAGRAVRGRARDDWAAPAADRDRVNPVAATREALLKGQALYQRHCARCHGPKGRVAEASPPPKIEPPDDLADPELQGRLSDGEILWKITTGLRDGTEVVMPSFRRQIPVEEDRWKVVLYVRSLAAPAP